MAGARRRAACGVVAGGLLLGGCKAESLGVEVPRGGPQAVSMEDLQRDTWLVGGGGGTDGWTALARRLQQMHTLPAHGDDHRAPGPAAVVCGRKEGRSAELVLVLAVAGDAAGTGGAPPGPGQLRLAALVSLAKALDLPAPPARTLVLCGVDGAAGREALRSHPVAPADRIGTVFVLGGPADWGTGLGVAARELELGRLPDDPAAVDFRQLRERVVAAHAAVAGG